MEKIKKFNPTSIQVGLEREEEKRFLFNTLCHLMTEVNEKDFKTKKAYKDAAAEVRILALYISNKIKNLKK